MTDGDDTAAVTDMAAKASAGEMPEPPGAGGETPAAADGSAGSGPLPTPIEALMSTEPAASPDDGEYADMDPRAADVIIGLRKVLNALGASVDSGMPAIGNFARAAYRHATRDGSGPVLPGSGDGDDDGETETFVPAGPPGAGGGADD